MYESDHLRRDLLARHWARALVAWRGFPVAIQALLLAVVVLLAFNGWGIGLTESAEELRTLRKTNLTTLVVWGLWWPAMIGSALALGRVWCTVCPMELVNRVADGAGRRLGYRRVPLGRWFRAGWFVLLAYLVLQILVAGISIHRVPHHTAVLLTALLAAALVTGVVFREPRSFCRSFCPAGALLSVYGRYTPIQLDVRNREVCSACEGKDCIDPRNRSGFDKRSCPSKLLPYAKGPSDPCVLCFQCAKVCPLDNVGFGLIGADQRSHRGKLLRPFEAAFVMLAAGFVAHEVVGEVKWLDGWFHWVPLALRSLVPSVSFGWFEAAWFLLMFPLLLWTIVTCLAYLLGHRDRLSPLLLAAATGAAPVVALAHLAKAVAKTASWASFLPFSVRDPAGMNTFGRLMDHSLQAPRSLADLPVIGWMMLALIAVVGWRSWCWLRQAPSAFLPAARAGFVSTAILFTVVLAIWTR